MIYAQFITLFVITVSLSYALIGKCRSYALKKQIVDMPNFRSSHSVPTPRVGGIGIVLSWLAAMACLLIFVPPAEVPFFLSFLSALLVAAIGLVDDIKTISARTRIVIHALAALLFIFILAEYLFAHTHDLSWLFVFFLSFIGVVWSVNLFNFMDGLDGFASTETCFVFGAGGWFLWSSGAYWIAFAAWLLVAANLGFLAWNKPRARIFLGDGGSGFIGFLIAAFAIIGQIRYDVPALLWAMLFGAFLFDATVTILRRMLRGEKWYSAHRSHAYQRLHHQLRWSHSRVLSGLVLINSLLAGLALLGYHFREYLVFFGAIAGVLLISAYVYVEKHAPMRSA